MKSVTVSLHTDEGIPVVRAGLRGEALLRGVSLIEGEDTANAGLIRAALGWPNVRVIINGEAYEPPPSKTAAKRQAHRESSIYRQGSGWIVSTFDPAIVTSNELTHSVAKTFLADWRRDRAVALMGGAK